MRALSLAEANRFRKLAARRGVSKVARSSRGFMAALQRYGSVARLPAKWKRKRAAFIKRHMAQVRKRREKLFKGGEPTRRHLALIMWAASPSRGLFRRTRKNPRKRGAAMRRSRSRNPKTGTRLFLAVIGRDGHGRVVARKATSYVTGSGPSYLVENPEDLREDELYSGHVMVRADIKNKTCRILKPGELFGRPTAGNPRRYSAKAKYIHRDMKFKYKNCDRRSIRTIRIGKRGKMLRICCPKGKWMPRKNRCKVGTKAFEMLVPKAGLLRAVKRGRRAVAANPLKSVRKSKRLIYYYDTSDGSYAGHVDKSGERDYAVYTKVHGFYGRTNSLWNAMAIIEKYLGD